MGYVLIRTVLVFFSLVLILHFGAILEPAHTRTLDVAHLLPSAASFPVSTLSGCNAQDMNQVRPATGLHCQFDTNVPAQITLKDRIPFERAAYVPTEISLVGSTVDVSDKPPSVEEHS